MKSFSWGADTVKSFISHDLNYLKVFLPKKCIIDKTRQERKWFSIIVEL